MSDIFDKIIIFDSNSVAWSEYHGMPHLSHRNILTGVAFGFLLQILALAEHYNTNRFVFCWDSRKSFRKVKHDWYKHKRAYAEKTEEEQRQYDEAVGQFQKIRNEVLPALGFSQVYMKTGFEADDLVASIVMNNPGDFLVVSTDNDLLQLLGYCDIYNHRKKEVVTKKSLWREWHLTPGNWVELKMLAGCSSDCVPGVPGFGEATAASFLRGELKPTSKKYQRAEDWQGKEIRRRNEWLVRLPLEGTPVLHPNFDDDHFDYDTFCDTCARYGFNSLLKPEVRRSWREIFTKDAPRRGMTV